MIVTFFLRFVVRVVVVLAAVVLGLIVALAGVDVVVVVVDTVGVVIAVVAGVDVIFGEVVKGLSADFRPSFRHLSKLKVHKNKQEREE